MPPQPRLGDTGYPGLPPLADVTFVVGEKLHRRRALHDERGGQGFQCAIEIHHLKTP